MPEITATIVGDTIGANIGERIVSVAAVYPRFLLPQVNTHRMIARSSRSSRAVPVKKLAEEVRNDPVTPVLWGKNQPGMQAAGELPSEKQREAERIWREAAERAARDAERLAELGAHKQISNRLLEPFVTAATVMTATEWDNFFALRLHEDAQPEMQALARAIKDAIDASEPTRSEYHLPFLDAEDAERLIAEHGWLTTMQISAARCARVSYRLFDGRAPSVEDDLRLAGKLLDAGHMSPFDHPAREIFTPPDGDLCRSRHLVGWMPARAFAEKLTGEATPRHLRLPEELLN